MADQYDRPRRELFEQRVQIGGALRHRGRARLSLAVTETAEIRRNDAIGFVQPFDLLLPYAATEWKSMQEDQRQAQSRVGVAETDGIRRSLARDLRC